MDNSLQQDKTIFDKIDSSAVTFSAFGFSPFNVLTNIKMWRRYIAALVIASSFLWVLLGFDSTWEVAEIYVMSFASAPIAFVQNMLANNDAFKTLTSEALATYGMGNHWSAPVIYGLFFLAVSYSLEDRGYKKSANFVLTSLLSFGAIGSFEIPWNFFYSTFQGQRWAFDFFHMKQMALVWSFSVFIILGVLAYIYLLADGFEMHFGKTQFIFLCLTLGFWFLWINYPLQITPISVSISGTDSSGTSWFGYWLSSKLFPQTYYVIDVNPWDNIASGMPHYVSNDILHAVNTLTKVFQTVLIYTICLVKRKSS